MKQIDDMLQLGWLVICCTLQLVSGQDSGERRGDVEARDAHHDTFMYAHVPGKKKYEFGYKRGNKHHWREHFEKGGDKHNFKAKVKWHDEKGGHGEHYWDYNHVPKYKHEEHKGREEESISDTHPYPHTHGGGDTPPSQERLVGSSSHKVPFGRSALYSSPQERTKAKRRVPSNFMEGMPFGFPSDEVRQYDDASRGAGEDGSSQDDPAGSSGKQKTGTPQGAREDGNRKDPQLIRGFIPSSLNLRSARQSEEAEEVSFAVKYFGSEEPELSFDLESGLVTDEKSKKSFRLVLQE